METTPLYPFIIITYSSPQLYDADKPFLLFVLPAISAKLQVWVVEEYIHDKLI